MHKILSFLGLLLLAGCAQLGSLSTYNVSEADLEQMLTSQLPKLTKQANVAGIPLKMAVEKMQVDIGPDNSDLVRINTDASAVLSLFGLSYPANLKLQIEGSPYYDATEKAIFIRSVKLLDSTIDAAGYRGNLAPVSNELLQLVNGYLASNPVYRLDQTNPTIRLLTAVPVNMAVQNGKLAFSPGGKP
tara:strand:- start:4010 stop:4573 length:564 start_codon:yes stop_codon:yes gene_type:complete